MWLNDFKIALIEKNTEKLNTLMDELPSLQSLEDIQQALYLLKEANELVGDLKDQTKNSMKLVKKNISFLEATQDISTNKLDIKS